MKSKRVLIINAGCLSVNCSANLCHVAYIRGFVDCGCEVVVISKNEKGQMVDQSICLPSEVKHIKFDGSKLSAHTSERIKKTISTSSCKNSIKGYLISTIKKIILKLYGPMGISEIWINNVVRNFKDSDSYDLVLTLSGPVQSHLAGAELIKKKRIKTNCFCELWEDPWQMDLFNETVDEKKLKLEEYMTSLADLIIYVSPLTLENQGNLFQKYKNKMDWLPLPFYYKDDNKVDISKTVYGYFGDYYPQSRNILPFYTAAIEKSAVVNICGNPSDLIKSTHNIKVMPRMSLEKLRIIENQTNVLVVICNLKGGQIPGKIYQYAATRKKILFILDGSEYEKEILKSYFSKYNRFYFCDNNLEDILKTMTFIEGDNSVMCEPVEYFSPQNIAFEIMKKCGINL